jgi:hypothetical protein
VAYSNLDGKERKSHCRTFQVNRTNKYVVFHLFENVLVKKTVGIFPDPSQVFIKRERKNKKRIEKSGMKYDSKPILYLTEIKTIVYFLELSCFLIIRQGA